MVEVRPAAPRLERWKERLQSRPLFICEFVSSHTSMLSNLCKQALEGLWPGDSQHPYVGIAYNTWNGYTEGYVAVPNTRNGDADYRWIKRLFQPVSGG
jgi:hypothetical protein